MNLTPSLEAHKQVLLRALDPRDSKTLEARLPEIRSADLAEILERLIEDEDRLDSAVALLACLPVGRQASVFGHLPFEAQDAMASRIEDAWLSRILDGYPMLLPDGGAHAVQVGFSDDLSRFLIELLDGGGIPRSIYKDSANYCQTNNSH